MNDILLKNILSDGKNADILIRDGKILDIAAPGTLVSEGCQVMDCTGKAAIPGFINMHCHAAMLPMKGIGEDMHFHDWIKLIWKAEESLDAEYVYWATKAACIEMIKSGTTTVNDHYWFPLMGSKAAKEMGMRPYYTSVILDNYDKEKAAAQRDACIQVHENWKQNPEGSCFVMGYHSIYTVSEESILWASEYARKNNLLIHFHLSETQKEVEDCKKAHNGLSPVEWLDSLDCLGPNCIAAHALWLSPEDIRILSEKKVNCVHNINSNTKLGSGYRFLYNEMKEAGINICLGTDGCASSNNLDMLETMKTSALFQKAWRNDPAALPLDELLAAATENGAKALRLDSGRIAVGMNADISIVDMDNTNFLSPAPFLANLIYSAHSDCIDSVICNGRFIMKNREIPGEKEIIHEMRRILNHKR